MKQIILSILLLGFILGSCTKEIIEAPVEHNWSNELDLSDTTNCISFVNYDSDMIVTTDLYLYYVDSNCNIIDCDSIFTFDTVKQSTYFKNIIPTLNNNIYYEYKIRYNTTFNSETEISLVHNNDVISTQLNSFYYSTELFYNNKYMGTNTIIVNKW